MAHVVLDSDQNALAIEKPGEMVISCAVLGDAVDDLHHSLGLTLRHPAAGMDRAASAGGVLEFLHHQPTTS